MQLTKTEFLEYLRCSKNFWLMKNEPELYITKRFSEFEQSKMREGYQVEKLARQLFTDGIYINGEPEEQFEKTKKFIAEKKAAIFQATFITERFLIVRVDTLVYNNITNCWDIYEVKSSTRVKTDRQTNHIKDVTYQRIVLEEAGVTVGEEYLLLMNSDYKKDGEIDVNKLFKTINITEEVNKALDITRSEIDEAVTLMNTNAIDKEYCSCLYLSRPNHCSSFRYFNQSIPDYSVHDIPRIRPDKIKNMLDAGIVYVNDITEKIPLTAMQKIQVELENTQEPKINNENIEKQLKDLVYPILFLDYETYSSAIPIEDGYSPHQHMPFQVSIHQLDENHKLTHYEILADKVEQATFSIVEFLKNTIPSVGTIVSWHASFENSINNNISIMYPELKEYFLNLNSRTIDLEKIFLKDFLHPGFRGKSSIKVVLPTLIPDFSYKDLDVQGGTEAMEGWRKMIFDDVSSKERENIKKGLLDYCAMDTLAMVELFKLLHKIIKVGK
ncbi:MAG: DUF2779 domain-containing protein [Bacteroidetes bacterium]|nr:DUF2779 domain-containing protein [Bacteroidota bacterium]